MAWKKTVAYFLFQSVRYARGWEHLHQCVAYYPRWKKFLASGKSAFADELPWLNFPALDLLEREIRPDFKIFEFGGGGSTLFFCKRAIEVVTVEDDPVWFDGIKKKAAEKNWKHWQGMLIRPEPVERQEPADPANPAHFSSRHKGQEACSFEKYARAIDAFQNDYFDIILVDGRARPSCIQQAIPHLKIGGLLIVDNTERPYYLTAFMAHAARDFSVESNQMAPIGYTPDFVRTSVFRKR